MITIGRCLRVLSAVTILAAVVLARPASAAYPDHPIRIICGYAAGSGADVIVRFFAAKLEKLAGQSVIVENRPGAFGNIATQTTVQAPPDGYRIMLSGTATVVGNLFLIKDIPFDPMNDLAPVSSLLRNGFVLAVGPDSKSNSVKELIADLKTKPSAKYGQSSGNSIASAELFLAMSDTKATRVSYKSSAEMVPDVASGELDFSMIDAVFAIAQAKQKRIKLLAATPPTRVPGAENIPTMSEAGLFGYDFSANWAAWFPKGTPKPIIDQMHAWLDQIVKSPEAKEFLAANGADPLPNSVEGTQDLIKADYDKWERIAKAAKLEKQ
ncbi:MAG: Bug family tripartite tricarboxylate transporter substrate binding protein [Xanthobacteraceae bacterium]